MFLVVFSEVPRKGWEHGFSNFKVSKATSHHFEKLRSKVRHIIHENIVVEGNLLTHVSVVSQHIIPKMIGASEGKSRLF